MLTERSGKLNILKGSVPALNSSRFVTKSPSGSSLLSNLSGLNPICVSFPSPIPSASVSYKIGEVPI